MKQTKFGKLYALIVAVLAMCMVFALTACGDKEEGSGSKTFKVNTSTGVVDVGKNITLMASGNGNDAVMWTSSNEGVATVKLASAAVTTAARVTGVSVGTATITATAGGKTVTVLITVTYPETITITKDGTQVPASIQLSQNGTVQLAAISTKGHNIAWESSSDLIATVSSTGLVTAKASSGTAVISAKCGGADNTSGDIKASVTVTIGSGVDAAYTVERTSLTGGEGEANEHPGKWMYWNEYDNVTTAAYSEGTVTLDFNNNGANWYNLQLFYTPRADEGLTAGQLYKVEFDANLEYHAGFEAANGHVTVNGNQIVLTAGNGHYTAYYFHNKTAFLMGFGWENGNPPKDLIDVTDATVKISNVTWTPHTQQTLGAPSFSIANNEITINDVNPAGTVKQYVLTLYDGETPVGSTVVKNGQKIDVTRITTNGTFQGKLKAIGTSVAYLDSPEATSANSTVVVENEEISYALDVNTGVVSAGTWGYWTSSWVVFSGNYTNGVVTATFSNNAGNWYDTQLKYKSLHATGDTYKLTITITVDAENIGEGKVSIGAGGYDPNNYHYNQVHNLHVGENIIEVDVEEGAANTLQITFGVAGENNAQCIQAGTITVSVMEG